MRIDVAHLSQLVMVIIGGPSQEERRAADRRRASYHRAFGLRRDAACLLDQLVEANGDLVHYADAARSIGRRGQVVDWRPRSPEVCMAEIREAVGSDAVETVDLTGWRLTPLGRFRARRARGGSFCL